MEENRERIYGEGSNLAFIVDSNIIFSIVVAGRRARVYRIISEHRDLELFAPEEVLIEFREHTMKLEKSARVEFWNKVLLAFSLIRIIPREVYKEALREAYSIARTFDAKDTPFIALSLKLELPLWTEDRGLLQASFKSGRYVALDTEAVDKLLIGESLETIREKLYRKLFK
ncbi:MAG: PIN domain-containing protein [Desulfurococcales archaeon]|nr:PIN domain-containing protein [Desulfurococcales archaeon]